jgi:hypothetical protein
MSWHMPGRYPASRTASALPRATSFPTPSFQYITYDRSGLSVASAKIMSIERPRTLPLQDLHSLALEIEA